MFIFKKLFLLGGQLVAPSVENSHLYGDGLVCFNFVN